MAEKGVRANAVAPGFTSHARSDCAPSEWRERYLTSSLTGRAGAPDDVAYCVLYLASDEAKHVAGQVVSVNGDSLSHMWEYAEFRALGQWLGRDPDL
jgi:3-oxoacyl-[acyl-carrier protein] reductase